LLTINSCNYTTHRTVSKTHSTDEVDPEPDYDITLDDDYQDHVTYIYMGNRSENFGTFFNKFYTALDDYDEAMKDYKASTIASYNRRLDSLNIVPTISPIAKENLNKVIERCSKIIQYNKNTRFLDDAVLLIGKSYYYMGAYLQAERKFSEFLSKLTKSEFSDEALLYLGRTKLRLGSKEEGVKILTNLLDNTKDLDIKAGTAFELGINALSENNYKEAVEYIRNSISYTKEDEKKAEKQYILAKILVLHDPTKAFKEYNKALDNTSDFDLIFYSKLNYAKSLNYIKEYTKAYLILKDLSKKYREYPEFKQLAELEIVNNLFLQEKYKKAIKKSFDVIIDFQNTRVSSDAYYYLAKYYEDKESDYLKALVNYKKVLEEFNDADYSTISDKRVRTLERYFTLLATINDTVKSEIPTVNAELEKYREKILKEKGIEQPTKEQKGQDEEETKGKVGGYSYRHNVVGRLSHIIRFDSIVTVKEKDALDSSKSFEDSLLTELTDLESKEENKFNAYMELAELFLYELDHLDSAVYYLKTAIITNDDIERESKALYTLATLYKNSNNTKEANDIFNQIIIDNPNSIFANESRKILGLPLIEIDSDPAESLFKEAEQNLLAENYGKAIELLRDIPANHPESPYLPRSIYTLGWIYEYALNDKDSAMSYYETLKNFYPESEYASTINSKLEYWKSLEKSPTDSNQVLEESNIISTEKEEKKIEEENPEEILEKKVEEGDIKGEGDIEGEGEEPDIIKQEKEKGEIDR